MKNCAEGMLSVKVLQRGLKGRVEQLEELELRSWLNKWEMQLTHIPPWLCVCFRFCFPDIADWLLGRAQEFVYCMVRYMFVNG